MIAALRRVGPIPAVEPEVTRAIKAAEDNTSVFAEEVRNKARERWATASVLTTSKTHTPQAGDALLIDTTAGDVYLNLPAAGPTNQGRDIVWVKILGANGVVFKATSGNLNGATAAVTFRDSFGLLTSHGKVQGWRAANPSADAEYASGTRVTTTYTVLATDTVLFCDTDGGAFTVTLPAGVQGRYLKLCNVGTSGNDLTVDGNGAEEVYGAATQLVADGEVVDLHYDATEGWF